MTPQERELITDLFRRLRDADTGTKDREADDLIRRLAAEHPGAAYLLTQTVIVQDQALTAAHTRIEELQRQVESQAPRSGGFLGGGLGLGGIFGGRKPSAPPPAPPGQNGPWGAGLPSGGPWGGQPNTQPSGPWGGQPSGGGFLQSALTTAVGVAGGALLFEGVQHMFGGGSASAASWPTSAPPVVENTTINNYYGEQPDDGGDFDAGADSGSFLDDI